MVGDRLNTDIAFGRNGGMKTLLVLTGISQLKDVRDPSNTIVPDYYINSLGDLKDHIR
jgi:ribonucleotide monophosphatase NagD (HAD superfamily)